MRQAWEVTGNDGFQWIWCRKSNKHVFEASASNKESIIATKAFMSILTNNAKEHVYQAIAAISVAIFSR